VPTQARRGAPGAKNVACGTGKLAVHCRQGPGDECAGGRESGRAKLRDSGVMVVEQVAHLGDDLEPACNPHVSAEIDDPIPWRSAWAQIVGAIRLVPVVFRCHGRNEPDTATRSTSSDTRGATSTSANTLSEWRGISGIRSPGAMAIVPSSPFFTGQRQIVRAVARPADRLGAPRRWPRGTCSRRRRARDPADGGCRARSPGAWSRRNS